MIRGNRMQQSEYDVIVIGGSFAGLSAAMQVARSRRSVLVIDGAQPRNRVSIAVHGFIGQDGLSPTQILKKFQSQLTAYPTVSLLSGNVSQAEGEINAFTVTTDLNHTFQGRRLILAYGIIDYLPNIPGIEQYWGKSVFHCPYCNAYEVAERRLGVLATQLESLHQAIILLEWCKDITLFTNNALQLSESEQQKLLKLGIKIEPISVSKLFGTADTLQGVLLENGRKLELDALFTLSDTAPASTLAEQLNCQIEPGFFGPVITVDPMTKETTTPGVYAAGDITRSFHKVSFAVADGNLAGVFSHKSLVLP